MHNAAHASLKAIRESVEQLVEDEDAVFESGELPSVHELKAHLNIYDDYTGYLSDGTWFHVQPRNIFTSIK